MFCPNYIIMFPPRGIIQEPTTYTQNQTKNSAGSIDCSDRESLRITWCGVSHAKCYRSPETTATATVGTACVRYEGYLCQGHACAMLKHVAY